MERVINKLTNNLIIKKYLLNKFIMLLLFKIDKKL
jgi:hypothetical protein